MQDIPELAAELKNSLEVMPMPVLCLNRQADIVYFNKQAATFFGLDGAGRNIDSLFPLTQADGSLSLVQGHIWIAEAYEKGSAEFNWMHTDAEGNIVPAHIRLQRARCGDDDYLLSYVQTKELGEELIADLQQTTNSLRTIFDAAPLSISLWTEDYSLISCNEETLRLFNVQDREEYYTKFFSFSPEFQPNGVSSEEMFHKNAKEAKARDRFTFEWLHRTADGRPLPAEVTLVWTHVNKVRRLVAYVKDLTEQKAFIRRLEEADERTQIMLDATPLACDLWDNERQIIDCNQEALNLFKVPSKKEYCERFFELSPEVQPNGRLSAEMAVEKVNEALATGVSEFEWMHRALDGEPIPSEVKLVRVIREGKYNIAGSIRDVRALKRSHEALVQAKEAAEAASTAKSRFLSNMSHEIRTPMNAIIGLSELLSAENLSDRQRKYVADIRASSIALLGIINEILDFSKIEAGKLEVMPVSFDLHELLGSLESTFTVVAAQKGLRFMLDMAEGLPRHAYGDDVRIRQTLVNILGNAIKFTSSGHVRLRARESSGTLHFAVEDTGIGIKNEDIPRIFKDFEQLDSDCNRKTGGTGLGLSITRTLMEMMGGKVWVESQYGKGSVFHLELPFIPGDSATAAAPHTLPDLCAPAAEILVVDDNETNLTVASGLLGVFGIVCETVQSGKEAIRKIQQKHYDIVFMDHMMPEMDGVETTRRLRDMGYAPDALPIIAMTANAIGGARESLLASGMNDYLSKPIDKTLLAGLLQKWLPPSKLEAGKEPGRDSCAMPAAEAQSGLTAKVRSELAGVDVDLALSRVAGMRDVFEKSLRILARRLPETMERLSAFLDREDLKGFAIEVHGAKGSFANIGAEALAEQAQELELRAKNAEAAYCRAHLPELIRGIAGLHSALERIIREETPEPEARQPGDIPTLKLQLGVARTLLDSFEGDDAARIIKDLAKLHYGEHVDGALADILRLIDEFEFMGAVERIDEIE